MKWVRKLESKKYYVERSGRIGQRSKHDKAKMEGKRRPSGIGSTGKIVESFM